MVLFKYSESPTGGCGRRPICFSAHADGMCNRYWTAEKVKYVHIQYLLSSSIFCRCFHNSTGKSCSCSWQLGSRLHQNININYVSFLRAKSGHYYTTNYLLIQCPCRFKNIYLLWKELCFPLSGVYLKLQYITEFLLHQIQHSILAHKIHPYDKKNPLIILQQYQLFIYFQKDAAQRYSF